MERIEQNIDIFKKTFGNNPDLIVRVPGRVNLIGEHTDYNEGFVLPVAINRDIIFLCKVRNDRKAVLHSLNFNETEEFSTDDIPSKKSKWSDYPRGVMRMFQDEGFSLKGMDVLIDGNVPVASGLSSSAAMEVGMSVVLQKINRLNVSLMELIKISQRAENKFVGVSCGIMDQFISCLGRKDCALFLDCRSLKYEYIPLNLSDVKIAICNTKVKRELANTFYNKRRAECTEGVRILKKYLPNIRSLRDVELETFQDYKSLLRDEIAKRCEHVIRENQRVLESVKVLKEGKIEEFGRLLYGSHESLKNLYEVSCRELDIMVDIARKTKGVIGSRMTGAGFGGCTIALIKEEAIDNFTKIVEEKYFELTNIKPEVYICETQDGAFNAVESCELRVKSFKHTTHPPHSGRDLAKAVVAGNS